ncbi:hypothetical protein MCETRH20_00910 [Methylophilaceae bacterium]
MTIKIRNCVFGFRCAQKWDEMEETSRDGVRFCKECEKDVYLISSEDKLLEAITLNRCVAIEVPKDSELPPKQKSEKILGMLTSYEESYGEPEPNAEYRKRLRSKKIV